MGSRSAGLTDVGCVRKHNEDDYLCLPDLGLFVVADGLGGHAAGEVASRIVVDTIREVVAATAGREADWPEGFDPHLSFNRNRLRLAVTLADQAIADDTVRHPERQSMGSTVVAALLDGPRVTLAHVGDSRAYLVGPGGIRQLTRDHSWVAEQVEAGLLTLAEARIHPFRNVITQALGSGGDLDIGLQELDLQEMERILLCSDGLSGMLSDAGIWEAIQAAPDPQAAVTSLVEQARARGGEDNITAVLVAQEPEKD